MSVIYEFVNNINQKVYVGQTVNFKKRIRDHRFNYNKGIKNTLFYNALRKYGWENFSINIIEDCSDELLNEKEIYWIEEKKSL